MVPAQTNDTLDTLLNQLDVANLLDSGIRQVHACATTYTHHQEAALDTLRTLPTQDPLEQLLCYYFYLNTAPLFTSAHPPASNTSSLVTGTLDDQHPARVQLQLLGTATPVLACIIHDVPSAVQSRLPAALAWLDRHHLVDPVQPPTKPPSPCSVRVPRAIGAIALDLDDTIVMHTLLPGIKVVFQAFDALVPTPLLKAMLVAATPHLPFLHHLAATMRSSQRPLFITSYGDAAWVRRAVSLLLDEAVPPHMVLCRAGMTDAAEVVDKTVWLTVVQQTTGLARGQVLLVDDSRRNVRAASAAGFVGLQVDRGEGLHMGNWQAVCRAVWPCVEKGADECGTLTPRGFEAAVQAEAARAAADGAPSKVVDEGRASQKVALRRRLLSMLQGGSRVATTHSLCAALDAYDSAFAKRDEAVSMSTPVALRLQLGGGEAERSVVKGSSLRRVLLVATGGAKLKGP